MTRTHACQVCDEPVVWLRSFGLSEPRPFSLVPDDSGEAVVDPDAGRVRYLTPGEVPPPGAPRYRPHWPCSPAAALPAEGERAPRPRPVPVSIVIHSHRDREWYLPFQTYRHWLVRDFDRTLDLLESDAHWAHYLCDGQTAMIDDYLEVRPEAEPRIRRLAAEGKLALGPWVTLADLFMVSGETIVRNLQTGMARARAFGVEPMKVGYAPDTFGHPAQMPQILRLGGIRHALVWRGVPHEITATAFWWEAPDGSAVRAEFLPHGYGHGTRVPEDPGDLIRRTEDYETTNADRLLGGVLVMNGSDHFPPQDWVGRVAAAANEIQDEYRFEVTSLEAYLAQEPETGLQRWRGELRSSGRHSVIMGVTSNRMDVKRACAAAERHIERRAERAAALWLERSEYPHRELEIAWRKLLLNAAHDSSCACSHDEVVHEVLCRYYEARQIGEAVTADAIASLVRTVASAAGDVVVADLSGVSRSSVIEVEVAGDRPCHLVGPDDVPLPSQSTTVPVRHARFDQIAEGPAITGLIGLFGPGRFGHFEVGSFAMSVADGMLTVTLVEAQPGQPPADLVAIVDVLRKSVGKRSVRVRVEPAPVRRLVAATPVVPGLGWAVCRVADGEGPEGPVHGGSTWIANELLRIDVAADGTWSIHSAEGVSASGLGRLVDDGDGGDTYNWSPPTIDTVVDRPEHVTVESLETGPARARLRITAAYSWPKAGIGDDDHLDRRSDEYVDADVVTTLEVRAGEPFVRVQTEWDNAAEDHRLRAHFPLPAAVESSHAGCAFAVVERDLEHQGNEYEAAIGTWPAHGFVDCSAGGDNGALGLAILHDGVFEYEVIDDETPGTGTEVAVTLARCVGYLSREHMRFRRGGAGPYVPTRGTQMPGHNVARYAVLPHRGNWESARVPTIAAAFADELDAVVASAPTSAERPSKVTVHGAAVSAVLRNRDGQLLVRLVALSSSPSEFAVAIDDRPATGTVVDLDGRPVAEFPGRATVRPHEIVTVALHA